MSIPWYPCWAISWQNPEASPPLIDTFLKHRPDERWAIAPDEVLTSEERVWSCWLKTVDQEISGQQIARSIDVSMLCALHDTRRISDALNASSITPLPNTVAWLLHIPVPDPVFMADQWPESELRFPAHSQEIERAAHRIIEQLEAFLVPTRPSGTHGN